MDQQEQKESKVLSGLDYLRRIICSPVYEVAQMTPLEPMHEISERLGNQVLVKREDRQRVHSFKIRGAHAMMANLTEEQRCKGVVAASAGNHAQGVALSATRMGIRSVIVMPITTPDIKIKAVRSFGGEVVLSGNNFDEAKKKAIELAKEEGYTFVPPFDHPDVIAGQGTIGLELLQQDAKINRIFVPVGGGGLAAGIAVLVKQVAPQVKVIGVESVDSACLEAALNAGEPVDLDRVGSFADGVAVKRIGDETYRLCQQYMDDIVTVSSDEICAAVKDLFEDVRAIAEPAGALALAGLKKYVYQHQIQGECLVHILSGANLNFHNLRYISERCELGERREAVFGVTIPEQKGSFLTFCRLLGGRMITEFNYRYASEKSAIVFVGVRLTGGEDEKKGIINNLQGAGYQVVDLSDNEMAKLHVRYMVGGHPAKELKEQFYSFEFPEAPDALLNFLQKLGAKWNITLFHYRSHNTDFGRVLAGFEVAESEKESQLMQDLETLGYECHSETGNPALKYFLTD